MPTSTKTPVSIGQRKSLSTEADASIVDLIDQLQKIDTTAPQAKLNETTISDNNGDRILL